MNAKGIAVLRRLLPAGAVLALLGLAGCVAYPAPGYGYYDGGYGGGYYGGGGYYAPGYAYAPPTTSLWFGFGGGGWHGGDWRGGGGRGGGGRGGGWRGGGWHGR